MPQSELRLIKHAIEYQEQSEVDIVPGSLRGIYVLYKKKENKTAKSRYFDLVYIGMTTSSIKRRLRAHRKSWKRKYWTHFSVFEVWDNVRDEEIKELEGLFRHLYHWDSRANSLNAQKQYLPIRSIITRTKEEWEGFE